MGEGTRRRPLERRVGGGPGINQPVGFGWEARGPVRRATSPAPWTTPQRVPTCRPPFCYYLEVPGDGLKIPERLDFSVTAAWEPREKPETQAGLRCE